MLALVPVWRPDVPSARRLYGFSDGLCDQNVVSAVEQLRFQRQGVAQMPPWLSALGAFAVATQATDPEWIESADEGLVLRQLQEKLAAEDGPVVLFTDAANTVRQLRLRLLLNGLPAHGSAHWVERFCDGESWQSDVLRDDPDGARACLALAVGHRLENPWDSDELSADQAMDQARGLCDLHQRGWM